MELTSVGSKRSSYTQEQAILTAHPSRASAKGPGRAEEQSVTENTMPIPIAPIQTAAKVDPTGTVADIALRCRYRHCPHGMCGCTIVEDSSNSPRRRCVRKGLRRLHTSARKRHWRISTATHTNLRPVLLQPVPTRNTRSRSDVHPRIGLHAARGMRRSRRCMLAATGSSCRLEPRSNSPTCKRLCRTTPNSSTLHECSRSGLPASRGFTHANEFDDAATPISDGVQELSPSHRRSSAIHCRSFRQPLSKLPQTYIVQFVGSG